MCAMRVQYAILKLLKVGVQRRGLVAMPPSLPPPFFKTIKLCKTIRVFSKVYIIDVKFPLAILLSNPCRSPCNPQNV